MRVAFVGLGRMGGPMARNLLAAGHSLAVFDVVRRNVDALTAAGAVAAASAREAANQAELVMTMLPSSPDVKSMIGGVAETMNLGVALGIDPKVLAGIINTSSGRCWSSDTYNPYPGVMDNVPAARGYTGGFGADLMLKDLGLATDAAKQAKQAVVLGAMAQQLYQIWNARGGGSQDFSAIVNLFGHSA